MRPLARQRNRVLALYTKQVSRTCTIQKEKKKPSAQYAAVASIYIYAFAGRHRDNAPLSGQRSDRMRRMIPTVPCGMTSWSHI